MRTILILMFLSIAATCFADDPLETLNTVEDTVSTMQHTLQEQGREPIFFFSEDTIGPAGWVPVKPCAEESAAGKDCGPSGSHLWKSRPAGPAELQPGVLVVAQDKGKDGAWVLATVTALPEPDCGLVAISAPFKAQVKSLRLVEQ